MSDGNAARLAYIRINWVRLNDMQTISQPAYWLA